MNYRLSCYANRVSGKNCYTAESNGRVVESKVFKFSGDNIKDNALNCVYQGLKVVRKYVGHDDVLYIDIQNIHLAEWLNGKLEYKGYSDWLDKVFEVLESIDCKYKFIFNNKPYAKQFGEANDVTKVNMYSIDDMVASLEA